MAKISSRGATEMARITTEFRSQDYPEPTTYLWVINSKGKVLRRIPGLTSYTVYAERLPASRDTLLALAEKAGHRVVRS